jgi:exopolyphosphatase/guanosine-5'-triphosphate,3'-diphosphate pyrophosphatase
VTRVAAIDCGTNSIRLLVADVEADAGTLVDLDRRMEIVRLGEGVDHTGVFAAEALERTFAACRRFAEIVRALGAERLRFVATSASRDVRNRTEFVAGVRAALGVEPEVVSGDEEARLSFAGATRELAAESDRSAPFLVVDIGGGSTEIVLGGHSVDAAASTDIGCVRMTERHLHTDPPTEAEIRAATADIDAALDRAAEVIDVTAARTLVGLAGSVTTVAAMALDLPTYDASRIHLSHITATDVHEVASRLLSMSREQRAALPFMHPGRVDVIGAGALVLDRVMARVPHLSDVLVSEHDILDGIAWSLA